MKSLSENYRESHANTHETFADLVFCALVVLILFVLALTVEVSQRVRATLAATEPVEELKVEELVELTPEEMQELSQQLREQQGEIKRLREQLVTNSAKVRQQLSAMAGEQRFTGAREPAAFHIAYNYRTKRFYFVPAKDLNEADRRNSGESDIAYLARKRRQLTDVALEARRGRGYTLSEAQAIYSAVSQYQSIVPTASSYRVEMEDVGIYYHETVCEYVSGDDGIGIDREATITSAILAVAEKVGEPTEAMYPRCQIQVDTAGRSCRLNGVQLSAADLRAILLSVDGRGLMLDLEGYTGQPPRWLYDGALAPAGYVAKTPKLPGQ